MNDVFSALSREVAYRPGMSDPRRARVPRTQKASSKKRERFQSVDNPWGLSSMQCEVMRLMADGKTQNEIAKILCISEKTVAAHTSRIREKMGVETAIQSVLAWDRHFRSDVELADEALKLQLESASREIRMLRRELGLRTLPC